MLIIRGVRCLTHLLVGIHGGKAAVMAGLTTLARDFLNLLLGTVGEISWVVIAGHIDGYVV